MLVNISMKLNEDILNGIKVIERTRCRHRNCYLQSSKDMTQKIYVQYLWFLCSASGPVLVNISMMFHAEKVNFLILETFISTLLVLLKIKYNPQTDPICSNCSSIII